jgi:hypothetical protein
MIEALNSSETSVLARAKWRNFPEDTVLHSHSREKLKSYRTVSADGLRRALMGLDQASGYLEGKSVLV